MMFNYKSVEFNFNYKEINENEIIEQFNSFTSWEKECAFKMACDEGDLNFAKKFFEINPINDINVINSIFSSSCCKGQIEIMKWLYEMFPKIDVSYQEEYPFLTSCSCGYLDIVKLLLTIKPTINITIRNNYAFVHACINGKIDIVNFILKIKPDIDISPNISFIIDYVPYNGHFEVLKILYLHFQYYHNLDLFTDNILEVGFARSCAGGNLEIAQWFLEKKPDIDISSNYDYAFTNACLNGHINVVSWLIDLHKNAILYLLTDVVLKKALQYCCIRGNIHICKLLLQQNENIGVDAKMFENACMNGNLELSEWLLKKAPNLDYVEITNKFSTICRMGFIDIAKMFYRINPNISLDNFNNGFVFACESSRFAYINEDKRLELLKWIVSVRPNLDVTILSNKAFYICCSNNLIKIVDLLVNLRPYHYKLIYNNDKSIILSWSINSVQERKWLERRQLFIGINDTNSVLSMLIPDLARCVSEYIS